MGTGIFVFLLLSALGIGYIIGLFNKTVKKNMDIIFSWISDLELRRLNIRNRPFIFRRLYNIRRKIRILWLRAQRRFKEKIKSPLNNGRP